MIYDIFIGAMCAVGAIVIFALVVNIIYAVTHVVLF